MPEQIDDLKPCRGCRVEPGTPHEEACDRASCPECGQQLFMCDEHDDASRPAIWHGIDPLDEVARQLNWWTVFPGIDRLVEDSPRVLLAAAYGQITWDPQTQRYTIGQIDNTVLDQHSDRAL
jgi:rubredoxin